MKIKSYCIWLVVINNNFQSQKLFINTINIVRHLSFMVYFLYVIKEQAKDRKDSPHK